MIDLFEAFVLIFLGLAGGMAVGGGFVAFLTVLQVIPRLVQLSGSSKYLPRYEMIVVSGALFWTIADFLGMEVSFFPYFGHLVRLAGWLFCRYACRRFDRSAQRVSDHDPPFRFS